MGDGLGGISVEGATKEVERGVVEILSGRLLVPAIWEWHPFWDLRFFSIFLRSKSSTPRRGSQARKGERKFSTLENSSGERR